jgi:hypothetical protein
MRSCHGPRKFVPWLATKAAFLNGKSAINALYTVLIARVCTYIQVYNIYIYTVYYHDSNMTYTYLIVYIYTYIYFIFVNVGVSVARFGCGWVGFLRDVVATI